MTEERSRRGSRETEARARGQSIVEQYALKNGDKNALGGILLCGMVTAAGKEQCNSF